MPSAADYAEMADWRVLPDGRGAFVYAQAFGTAKLMVGPLDAEWAEDQW